MIIIPFMKRLDVVLESDIGGVKHPLFDFLSSDESNGGSVGLPLSRRTRLRFLICKTRTYDFIANILLKLCDEKYAT